MDIPSHSAGGGRLKWSLIEIDRFLRKYVARIPPRTLESVAVKTWQIAPGETAVAPPAFSLPGQIERVKGWAFSDEHPRRAMEGGNTVHGPTRAFLLKDAWLFDGALYKDDAYVWLTPRSAGLPRLRVDREVGRGAMFCTPMGNKYFGQWLMDDCATYPLARDEGIPVMTDQPVNPHTMDYEELLGMEPTRLHDAFFKELVVFDDVGQNRHKHLRFQGLGEKILSRLKYASHPGVFILRGRTGELRLMHNEIEVAERLRDRRGFKILDPSTSGVDAIVDACAGARTVVGIEGSGLMHGILLLRQGGAVLTLQPPNRFVCVYKHLTDRDGQYFGFVVGSPAGTGFTVDPDEVEKTLDLFPS
jgi:hypothetical protein